MQSTYNNYYKDNKAIDQNTGLFETIFYTVSHYTESTTEAGHGRNINKKILIASNISCVEVVDGWQ